MQATHGRVLRGKYQSSLDLANNEIVFILSFINVFFSRSESDVLKRNLSVSFGSSLGVFTRVSKQSVVLSRLFAGSVEAV